MVTVSKMPQKIKMIKTELIFPNPYQTRRLFEMKSMEVLTESIKRHGVLCPVILRPSIRGYEIICGQRRVRAAISAGIKEIPAIVVNATDKRCALLSMTENECRENLSLQEKSEGYYNLMSFHRIKKEQLAQELSGDISDINEKVRILSLAENVRNLADRNNLPQKYRTELLKIHDTTRQEKIISEMTHSDKNYELLRELVKKELSDMKKEENSKPVRKSVRKRSVATPLFVNTLEETVKMLRENGAEIEKTITDNDEFVQITLKLSKNGKKEANTQSSTVATE